MTAVEVTNNVGLIFPPPEIRGIIDKTANFVARNGAQFEDRIKENEKFNNKFCFFNQNDPYRAYYDHKVAEVKKGIAAPKKPEIKPIPAIKKVVNVKLPPKQPPALEFIIETPCITALEIEIIKTTALFVARNGRQFMTSVAMKNQKNQQYDFLKSNSPLFSYFTKLVEQYTKILIPRNIEETLKKSIADKFSTLKIINSRVEYLKYVQEEKKKADADLEEEKNAFASIDWHDFVVVETVEFNDSDDKIDLPYPMSIKELENMNAAQKRVTALFAETAAALEEEEELRDIEMKEPEAALVPVEEVTKIQTIHTGPKKIRTDYVSNVGKLPVVSEPTQICPRCGLAIKASEMKEHVRIELLDPKWRQQKAVYDSRNRDSNLLSGGADISKNLSRMSGFVGGDNGAEHLKTIDKTKTIWDGQVDPSQKMPLRVAEGTLLNTMGPQIPSLKPFPPVPSAPLKIPGIPPLPFVRPLIPGASGIKPILSKPIVPPPPPVKSGPVLKKQKVEELTQEGLIAESQFLAKYSGSLNITIKKPDGESFVLKSLELTTTVNSIKEMIATEVDLAVGKQKLVTSGGLVMKNSASLAYYNLVTGSVLTLGLKERGGRK